MLHEYKIATNMTEQFAALAAIAQNPGKTRDDVLADFYSKWQHDFLVNLHIYGSLVLEINLVFVLLIVCMHSLALCPDYKLVTLVYLFLFRSRW